MAYYSYGNCTPIQYYIPPTPGCQGPTGIRGPTGPAGSSLYTLNEYSAAATISSPSSAGQIIVLVSTTTQEPGFNLTLLNPIYTSGGPYDTITMYTAGDTITLISSNDLANWWIISQNGTVTLSLNVTPGPI